MVTYRKRKWIPRSRNTPKGLFSNEYHIFLQIITEFPEELTSYGLTEENLLTALQQVGDSLSVDLKLTQTPSVRFYQSLHNLLKKKTFAGFTNKTLIGMLYLEIDTFLRAKGGRADNIYRFVENLSKVPPDQPVNYRIELATQNQNYESRNGTLSRNT